MVDFRLGVESEAAALAAIYVDAGSGGECVLPVPATHHKAAQVVVVAVLHCSPVPFVAARSCDGVAGSRGAAALA
jgi:hypothetical protein